jgi:hypothetical protein
VGEPFLPVQIISPPQTAPAPDMKREPSYPREPREARSGAVTAGTLAATVVSAEPRQQLAADLSFFCATGPVHVVVELLLDGIAQYLGEVVWIESFGLPGFGTVEVTVAAIGRFGRGRL